MRGILRSAFVSVVLACPLLSGTAGAQTTAPAPRVSTTWKRVTSDHLEAVGDASERDLRFAATAVEAFRAAVLEVIPGLRLDSPVPTRLVVFRDEKGFAPVRPRDADGRPRHNVVGYFTSAADLDLIVMGLRDDRRSLEIIFHEYTHYITHRNIANVPDWLDEGLAEVFSTFGPDRATGRPTIGEPHGRLLPMLRNEAWHPLRRLLSPTEAAKIIADQTQAPMFYAQSWALVHYLLLADPRTRSPQMTSYLSALARGVPEETAFMTAFQTTADQMEAELRRYVQQRSLGAVVLAPRIGVAATTSRARPILEADAQYIYGDLLMRVGALAEAEIALRRALVEAPRHRHARLSLALVLSQRGLDDEAIALMRAVGQEDPSVFGAQLFLGVKLMTLERYDEALQAYERAASLNPRSPSAWFGVSDASLALDRAPESEGAFLRATALDPSPDWARRRAYSGFRFGHDRIAARQAEVFLIASGTTATARAGMAAVASLAHRRLGQPQVAEVLLAQVRMAQAEDSWNARLIDFLAGRISSEGLLSRSATREQQSVAHTYIGLAASISGQRDEALVHLRYVKAQAVRSLIEYGLALSELRRLEAQGDGRDAVPSDGKGLARP